MAWGGKPRGRQMRVPTAVGHPPSFEDAAWPEAGGSRALG